MGKKSVADLASICYSTSPNILTHESGRYRLRRLSVR
jgi:hypothetical protein